MRPQLLPRRPPLPSPASARCEVTVHILAGESEKRLSYHLTSCSVENIFAFFYRRSRFDALPRCPRRPPILPQLLPALHSIAISRDAFTPKGLGLMALCLLLCDLLLGGTRPRGLPRSGPGASAGLHDILEGGPVPRATQPFTSERPAPRPFCCRCKGAALKVPRILPP